MKTRRDFLTLSIALSAGVCALPSRAGANGRHDEQTEADGPPDEGTSASEAMDEALDMLSPYAASFRGGLSNHGPMTAEALIALGHHEAVIGWVDQYRGRLEARSMARARIEASAWRDALGKRQRVGDWEALFTEELAEAPWREVVGQWVPRLAPGMAAAGLHGVIRAGHAVCSLRIRENALRLDELARALAYWAAEYLPLPGKPSEHGSLVPSRALQEIELLPREERRSRGLISTEMKDLVGSDTFPKTIDLVDPRGGSPTFMSDLLATFAAVYVNSPVNSFEFLHAVTGSAAVAELLPFVEEEDRDLVRAYTWQVAAGVVARYSRQSPSSLVEYELAQVTIDDLVGLAVDSGDEHTIKLAASCSREWQRNPDPRLLAAIAERVL